MLLAFKGVAFCTLLQPSVYYFVSGRGETVRIIPDAAVTFTLDAPRGKAPHVTRKREEQAWRI